MEVTLVEWAEKANKFAVIPEKDVHLYLSLAIVEECGELYGIFAKAVRKGVIDKPDGIDIDRVVDEIGDVMWSASQLAVRNADAREIVIHDFGIDFGPRFGIIAKWKQFASARNVAAELLEVGGSSDIHLALSIANWCGVSPRDVLERNISKLERRSASGTIAATTKRDESPR